MATKIVSKVWHDGDGDPSVTVYDTEDQEFATYTYDPSVETFYKTVDDYGGDDLHEDYVPKKVRKLLKSFTVSRDIAPDAEVEAVAGLNYLLTLSDTANARIKELIKYTEDNE